MTTYYTETHQWIRKEGDSYIAGITDYAQNELGPIVFVSLPSVGQTFKAQDEAAVVESMKTASEVYMPVAGKVETINARLNAEPFLVNADAEGEGWFFTVSPDNPSDVEKLMTKEQYDALTR